jgi:benzylsuccinate CoA-transferase BbsF subunit
METDRGHTLNISERNRMPLEGLRVADFSWVQAGPWVGRYFANYGAEVIKIESTRRVDWARAVPGGPASVNGKHRRGALFTNFNTDKFSITLNLTNPKGVEVAKRLIAKSDVVCENFTAGFMDKIGLGYEELVKTKPDIIMISMPVFGKTGPRRAFAGYGTGIQAAAGLNAISGFPNRDPAINVALSDTGPNPTHATVAALSALHYRNRTGRGQYVELAQFESALAWTETTILDYTVNGRVRQAQGNRSPYASPHGIYRCLGEDRWCAIAVLTEEQWKAFCTAIGNPAWVTEAKFSTLPSRKSNEDELDRLIEEWTSLRIAEEVMRLMQAHKVPAGVAQTGEDLMMNDLQVRHCRSFLELDHPDGKALCEGASMIFSKTPGKVRKPGPGIGEHNEYVYGQVLGMSEDEINECYVNGVFD